MQKLDIPQRNIVICDLDGTLALDEHRSHHLKENPRNWDKYFAACEGDSVNHPVAQLVRILHLAGKEIYIFTGRIDSYRSQTALWLENHNIPFRVLRMRPAALRTDDYLLKVQWVEEMDIADKIWMVLEDRKRVVDAWRSAGYTCLQVRPGDF